MKKVGWIFAHPPREEGFLFSSAEVITAATLQLEAADGVNDTPFVTVKVCVRVALQCVRVLMCVCYLLSYLHTFGCSCSAFLSMKRCEVGMVKVRVRECINVAERSQGATSLFLAGVGYCCSCCLVRPVVSVVGKAVKKGSLD